MNERDLQALMDTALAEARAAADAGALEAVRVRYLGRKGALPAAMQHLKTLPPAERGGFGRVANAFRDQLEALLAQRRSDCAAPRPRGAALDWSRPGLWPAAGVAHPISRTISEACAIFARLGFTVADGPDVETRFNNFEALNTPAHHPSLDTKDTFWLESGELLRTQTSPVQIRVMLGRRPPVRIITPGRTYRRDTTDATHSANFHQIEGLYVDTQPVSLADLKGTLAYFAREMMGPGVGVRFRPHFFPFTEPSVEVDFSCHLCAGKGCRVCKQSGWIEIAGAGMVDPRVFEKVGYDPEACAGYAFGMGVERIAMIKYGIGDIRHLYENDRRFLAQFA